jgi:hypothetical protein
MGYRSVFVRYRAVLMGVASLAALDKGVDDKHVPSDATRPLVGASRIPAINIKSRFFCLKWATGNVYKFQSATHLNADVRFFLRL